MVEAQVLGKQNAENSPQRSLMNSAFQPRSEKQLHTCVCGGGWGQGVDAQVQVSDTRERTRIGCHEDTLRGIVQCI